MRTLVQKALYLTNGQVQRKFVTTPALPHTPHTPFAHKFFISYKRFFDQNANPLVGGIPSYYLGDIKPIKNWKFSSLFPKSGEVDPTHLRCKAQQPKLKAVDFKQTVRKRLRLRLIRSFLNQNLKTPAITQHLLNFKSITKRLPKFKPLLRRIMAPMHISKWRTSYPLMFTNDTQTNKLLRPQIDLTIKTFIHSRSTRRVRRFRKILFRKIKRSSRYNPALQHPSNPTHKQKSTILTTFLKHRCRSRQSSITQRVYYPKTIRLNTGQQPLSNFAQAAHGSSNNNVTSHVSNYLTNTSVVARQNPLLRIWHKRFTLLIATGMNFKATSTYLLHVKQKFDKMASRSFLIRQLPASAATKNSHPSMRPRTGKNFIFKNFGIFLTSFMLFNQKNPFTYKYLFKKKIFSFLYPNEVRNALMARKKRIVFYQLVYKVKHKSKQRSHYSFASFNKSLINQYRISLKNKSNRSIIGELFKGSHFQTSSSCSSYGFENYTLSRDEILYTQNFSHRGVDLSFKRSEVKIPRVRFRPGYQRMWRNARNALKESMGLKFIYQQQLTRCLVRFYKNSNKYSFARSEMSANRIIMYSRLLPDAPTVDIFINQKLIYLNGKLLYAQQAILVPNDLVQLVVSVWYYVAYRWISNWTLKRHKKFKKLVYRKGLAGKHKVMKLKKQRSYYTPNWIYLARYDISDIKPFLEVDYLTLSAFILYEPFTTYYYTPDESPDFRPNIYRMYNWKYIT